MENKRLAEGRVEPGMVRIRKVVTETPDTKSFILEKNADAKPGQFAMLWLPGVDEKPMSFSGIGSETMFTVKRVGEFSEKMHALAKGDEIGFRGPYGRGFSGRGRKVCLLAGGCGAAPLLPLAQTIKARDVRMIVAAKTKADLLFLREFKKCGKTIVATDDGSAGMRGFATDALAETLKEKGFDRVYACGREEMLAKVLKMVQKAGIPAELSTERYMKCGVGLCGQCSLGGKLVCKDGPVFSSDELAKTEFGKYNLDKCGLRVCFDR